VLYEIVYILSTSLEHVLGHTSRNYRLSMLYGVLDGPVRRALVHVCGLFIETPCVLCGVAPEVLLYDDAGTLESLLAR
jgi:hypothetical protein